MTTTKTRTRTKSEDTTPPTFADVARKRIRAALTVYRSLVEKAVAGQQLGEEDMVSVYDSLERLKLAPFTFERDQAGIREHARNVEKWNAAVEREPAERERGRQVSEEITTLTKRLNELKAEAHRLSTSGPLKQAGYLQRVNQLVNDHPHVLIDLDKAVEVRAQAMRVDAPTPEPVSGRVS